MQRQEYFIRYDCWQQNLAIAKNLKQQLLWLRMTVLTDLTVMQRQEYFTGHDCWQQTLTIAKISNNNCCGCG